MVFAVSNHVPNRCITEKTRCVFGMPETLNHICAIDIDGFCLQIRALRGATVLRIGWPIHVHALWSLEDHSENNWYISSSLFLCV